MIHSLIMLERDFLKPEDFILRVDSGNFHDDKAATQLAYDMRRGIYQPIIKIGFDGDILYRLVPEPFGLQAHPRDGGGVTGRPMLGSHFLGVNSTVQPKGPAGPASRREANLSEISTNSGESEDANAPGFIFFQLGDLQYAKIPAGQHGWPENALSLEWESTGFNLVARLGPTGRVESIWAIYNMFPEDEMDWWRNPVTH
ncbi:hypothetical protein VTI74DRAFT_2936 [Chaetomium olivicolor]